MIKSNTVLQNQQMRQLNLMSEGESGQEGPSDGEKVRRTGDSRSS